MKTELNWTEQKLKLANGLLWKYRNDVTLVPTTVVRILGDVKWSLFLKLQWNFHHEGECTFCVATVDDTKNLTRHKLLDTTSLTLKWHTRKMTLTINSRSRSVTLECPTADSVQDRHTLTLFIASNEAIMKRLWAWCQQFWSKIALCQQSTEATQL